jgi:hypothetical protein
VSGRGSTGLGIASVLQCVDELGGTLELRTAPGRGTRARLLVPDAALTRTGAGDAIELRASRALPAEKRAHLRALCAARGARYSEAGLLTAEATPVR